MLAGWGVAGLLVSLRFFRWSPQRPARGRLPGVSAARVSRAAVRAGLDELFTGVTQQLRSLEVFQAVR